MMFSNITIANRKEGVLVSKPKSARCTAKRPAFANCRDSAVGLGYCEQLGPDIAEITGKVMAIML
jgi:hypothetical protein